MIRSYGILSKGIISSTNLGAKIWKGAYHTWLRHPYCRSFLGRRAALALASLEAVFGSLKIKTCHVVGIELSLSN